MTAKRRTVCVLGLTGLASLLPGCGGTQGTRAATVTVVTHAVNTSEIAGIVDRQLPPVERITVPRAELDAISPIVASLRAAGFFSEFARVPDADLPKYVYRKELENQITDELAISQQFGAPRPEFAETDPARLATRSITSPTQIADWLYGLEVDPEDPEYLKLSVAAVDRGRTWYDDPEADVVEENQVYVDAVGAWSRMSRGTFTPTDFEERWDSPGGPVRLTFVEDGQAHRITLRVLDDWMDMDVVCQIEKFTAPKGIRFVSADTGGQQVFLAALRDAEIATLRRAGWRFGSACDLAGVVDGSKGFEDSLDLP